jgi:hypothetical protein
MDEIQIQFRPRFSFGAKSSSVAWATCAMCATCVAGLVATGTAVAEIVTGGVAGVAEGGFIGQRLFGKVYGKSHAVV